ncbi:hypothetical protein [Cerasicoccus arenae]|uniref:Uncharacterized protein n=1 Tax=Cerasicoccus arenae TaxID=424488 RepID=A0A8J3GBI9_9BACT|nr:hypothetical protein [Cerasicoccus arenae]MBK1857721.1 hypothetical protein [Cerasicoccus arenae]GHB91180.1 hypothetical protein GCM10007047_02690 [Cerasicoccus arenae]
MDSLKKTIISLGIYLISGVLLSAVPEDKELLDTVWHKLLLQEEAFVVGRLVWRQEMLATNNPRMMSVGPEGGSTSFENEFYFSDEGFYLKRSFSANDVEHVTHYYRDSLEQILFQEPHTLRIGLSVVAEQDSYPVIDARVVAASGREWMSEVSMDDVSEIIEMAGGDIQIKAESDELVYNIILDPEIGYLAKSWEATNKENGNKKIISNNYNYLEGLTEGIHFPSKVTYRFQNGDVFTEISYNIDSIDFGVQLDEAEVRSRLLHVLANVYDTRIPDEPRSYNAQWPDFPVPSYNEFLELCSSRRVWDEFRWERRHLSGKIAK